MNDTTIISSQTPHTVSVAEGSRTAARLNTPRVPGQEPSIVDVGQDRFANPQDIAGAVGDGPSIQSTAPGALSGAPTFARASRNPATPTQAAPPDTDHALLADWQLGPILIERIQALHNHNARVSEQLDRLSPAPRNRSSTSTT